MREFWTELEELTTGLPKLTRQAISMRVPIIAANFERITGTARNRAFFYREAGISDDRRKTKFQQFSELYFAIALADRKSGRLIETGFAACVAAIDRHQLPKRGQGFWEIEERISNTMTALRKCQVAGDLVGLVMSVDDLQKEAAEIRSEILSRLGDLSK